jgi:hypothetical protein
VQSSKPAFALLALVILSGCSNETPSETQSQAAATENPTVAMPVEASARVEATNAFEGTVLAQDQSEYSPYVDQNYPLRPLFGDTHLHTSYSTDAGLIGNRLGPDEAYQFARGEEITSSAGVRAKLQRPLDFLVVADHAENLGLAPMIAEKNPDLLNTEFGKQISDLVYAGAYGEAYTLWGVGMNAGNDPLEGNDALTRKIWERITTAAEKYNDPSKFTAIIGFEWTSSPAGNNLHRNVLFRDAKDKADQIIPLSNYDTSDPEKLWEWMDAYEQKTGGKLHAIAHNGNLSNGLMFDDVTQTDKQPLTSNYAERRMRWEPVYEVVQIKGDGETHPALSPNDEFADFGIWDKGSFGPEPKTPDMLPREYARAALQRGMQYEQSLGVNPFKFGMIGSTDSHTSLATSEASNFFSKATPAEPGSPGRWEEKVTGFSQTEGGPDITIRSVQSLSAGLAGVWAKDNTRESLWDAFKRKEVYATSGTRMSVRVFAGWDYSEGAVDSPNFVRIGYQGGVPMGGDLSTPAAGNAPRLINQAQRDPDGANLDRVQIIKGWVDSNGATQEQIYDVACADDRSIVDNGCDSLIGNTVDVTTATYSNRIGDAMLSAWWQDPDFNAQQRAFYYVRVLEIPTPRWTTYDAVHFKLALPLDVPATLQQRAYTSPIWYTPAS